MKLNIASALILSLFTAQASSSTLFESNDWVKDNAFTNGVEGPAVDTQGVLYAVNYQQQGTIGKVLGKEKVETLVTLKNGSIGNGIRFDKKGNMYIADYVNHNVLTIAAKDLAQGGELTDKVKVFAHNAKMNQPNDLAIMDNGILFASDPNWQTSTGNLWRINQQGETSLLEANMGTTNGVEVSPDNNTLYVNESVQRKVWRYDLDRQGNVSNKQLLIEFDDFGLDGMRTDKAGNLYIARYGAGVIAVVSPKGNLLREIKLTGQFPTNVAFGGKDGKTVFVTMQKRGAIETFNVDIADRGFNL
ncbi:SMP-30/gluconolactonase/LRE family protein [Pseudoalteromonas spongiae]|uniref:SMP-30/gluconolactonase/LRE family protein n=1 Tax=Pseudoalteromonas spongiae TaxID=298657 RepID=UPI00110A7180|nr:SMP-30/gluconolactonase/LRE family protein [Pseudoalteromonas spongiae]TMO82765.1 gluconolactonase [Pseudoalteromonas spongiae]